MVWKISKLIETFCNYTRHVHNDFCDINYSVTVSFAIRDTRRDTYTETRDVYTECTVS